MFTFPETRFDLCGDEYIYAEIAKDMSAESNFKAIAITNELRKRNIPGIIEIYPANASYLVRYNPNLISPYDLLDYLREIDCTKSNISELNLKSKMIEIPIWYDDPLTREYAEKFKQRHQNPQGSNFEYVMKVNGFHYKEEFIEAHSRMPYLITMLGFIPGTAWGFPLGLSHEEMIQAPKYYSPRTDTPKEAVGIGGAFTVIYPSRSSGSYQLIGMSAVPVYDQKRYLKDFNDSYFLANPGNLWKYRSVNEQEFYQIREKVKEGSYQYKSKTIDFSAEEYVQKKRQYIQELMEGF
ncbi:carboxyltransferase domain-containing protein [Bacillus sp. FJAT-47783]|uniref:5-oxoprolinase subunit B family protein n=1 Tax=Bacillus sp. FJAT-47783 TaxID=2922712 RepID=UPI001FAD111D|nr:carboxyltransferase domain-containing protein [Bacillus sp. FJAT-47783]